MSLIIVKKKTIAKEQNRNRVYEFLPNEQSRKMQIKFFYSVCAKIVLKHDWELPICGVSKSEVLLAVMQTASVGLLTRLLKIDHPCTTCLIND